MSRPEKAVAVVTHIPPAAQLAAYADDRKRLLDWIRSHLVAGVDYGVIHRKLGRKPNQVPCPNAQSADAHKCERCGSKPTLLKPGAEKIDGLFQVKPIFTKDADTWDMMGQKPGLICLLCNLVTDNGQGVSVAEGRGCRDVEQDYGVANTTIKMCEKSAQVNATLRMAGLSEIFTQDVEEMGGSNGGEDEKPGLKRPQPVRAAAAAPSPVREPGEDDGPPEDLAAEMREQPEALGKPGCITQGQFEALMAVTHKGRGETALREKLQKQFGLDHIHDLPANLYDAVKAWAGQKPTRGPHARIVRR